MGVPSATMPTDTGIPLPEVKPSTSTASPEDEQADPKKNQEDVNALEALIAEIGAQFQEILKRNFPKPRPNAIDEPLLGATQQSLPHSPEPDEQATTIVEIMTEPATGSDTTRAPRPSTSQIQRPKVQLKMDKFQLPCFDGHLMQWLSFRDQFKDLVHDNPDYTDITKFIHLRSHLKGSALEAINGFTLSSANYEAAWYILQRRYNKPDQIIDEYLRSLDTLPVITTPTSERLIAMVNCANQILRVLPVLGVNVMTWATIIKFKLTSKLYTAY